MKGNDRTEQALGRLKRLRDGVDSPVNREELLSLLTNKSNHVVGGAADLIGDWEIEEAIGALEETFDRFMEDPVKVDPTCSAKRPLVENLIKIGGCDGSLFLAAARHVQMEPMWGKPVDTAASVRGLGGRGLFSMHYPGAMEVHAELIMDREIETRRIAVDTLTELGTNDAMLLLRIGALGQPISTLDTPPPMETITAECLSGLMKVEPEGALDFVAKFLRGTPEQMEGAALAIGESHHADAFAILSGHWGRLGAYSTQLALCLPIALTRTDEAFEFLGKVVRDAPERVAVRALEVMELFVGDPERAARILKFAEERVEPGVAAAKRVFE